MVNKRFLVLLLALAVVGLAHCAFGAAKQPAYVIGAIFTTSGDNAPLGVPERETVEMLEKQVNAAGGINGHPVKVDLLR